MRLSVTINFTIFHARVSGRMLKTRAVRSRMREP